jgi:hypothetical protein
MREIRTLRATWRGLETWNGRDISANRRASPRPYLREAGGEIPPAYSPVYQVSRALVLPLPAIDRSGALVDVRLSETRDMEAAKAFSQSAKTVTGVIPARVTTDGHHSYPRATQPNSMIE